jgi:ABC-2 type transport system ATP-binding protein
MSIEVQHVSKHFGKQKALDQVSFTVQAGEIAGFIGPNGAGKSTLMKIMCGLIAPDSGMVRLNGMDAAANSIAVRKKLGYLPEHNPLYPDMYVEEYLQYVARIYGNYRNSRSRVREVIALTGLSPEKHKRIGILSKGYRQRVGLAQAIIHDPEVLILDEPTTGLDPNQIVEIRNLISGLGKKKTVILSTHILQEVEAICSRVIIINKGQIMASDLTGNIASWSSRESHTVVVEFNKEPSREIFQQLNGVEAVKMVNPATWLIQTSGNAEIREALFRIAVENNLVILSLHRKDKKLEDVFRELTN